MYGVKEGDWPMHKVTHPLGVTENICRSHHLAFHPNASKFHCLLLKRFQHDMMDIISAFLTHNGNLHRYSCCSAHLSTLFEHKKVDNKKGGDPCAYIIITRPLSKFLCEQVHNGFASPPPLHLQLIIHNVKMQSSFL